MVMGASNDAIQEVILEEFLNENIFEVEIEDGANLTFFGGKYAHGSF